MTPTIEPRSIRRILVRAANWVGDAVMTTPVLQAVRQHFPKAEIHLLAKSWVTPIFEHSPRIDRLLSYDSAGRHGGWAGKLRLCRELRRLHFDLALLMQNAFEAAFLAWGAGIPRRLGYKTDARQLLLTHGVPVTSACKAGHQIDYYLGILNGVGIPIAGRQLELFLSPEEHRRALHLLEGWGMTLTRPLVGISPGATFGDAKRWLPDHYAALCRRLQRAFGAQILLFGAPAEAPIGERIVADLAQDCVNLCGKTRLREAMALIARCGLFVTNDSGLMHVAAAWDIPQVAVIGPTNPVATGPSNPRSRIVQAPTDCSPCLRSICPTDHRCMRRISVEQVFTAAAGLLQAGDGQAGEEDR